MNTASEPRSYLVVGSKPWNRRVYDEVISRYPGDWHYIGSREELSVERIRSIGPRYIFFLHWSWKVPQELLDEFECVCFHMTDVPYGRGGSPLQNLIVRGHTSTQLTALKMVQEFDAGPVYMKEPLCLAGNAEEILIRACRLSAHMIRQLVEISPEPVPQVGEIEIFKRRRPEQSELPDGGTLEAVYDFIRMLDGDGYPRAFFERGGFRFEFQRAVRYDGRVTADVIITPVEDGPS